MLIEKMLSSRPFLDDGCGSIFGSEKSVKDYPYLFNSQWAFKIDNAQISPPLVQPCTLAEGGIYPRCGGTKFWVAINTRNGRGIILYVYYCGDWIGAVESLADDGNTLILNDIVIFEQYRHLRGKGLGRKMLQYFLTRARQKRYKPHHRLHSGS